MAGTNTALNCQGCGNGDFITINYSGDASPTGTPGINGQPYYPLANFSQPTGANVAGFGNTLRNYFRRPSVWNVDMSVFKSFQIGRWRPEFRLEAANVFNHTVWGRPVVGFTANNFMQFTPQSTVVDNTNQQNTPGSRAGTDRAAHAVLVGPLRPVAAVRLPRAPASLPPTPPPATSRDRPRARWRRPGTGMTAGP